MTITYPLIWTFPFVWTKQHTTFKIQLKVRHGKDFIGDLVYSPRTMLCIVQHLLWTYVFCVIVNFILLLILWKWRTIFQQIIKGSKSRKFTKFCTYVLVCKLVTLGRIVPSYYSLKRILSIGMVVEKYRLVFIDCTSVLFSC